MILSKATQCGGKQFYCINMFLYSCLCIIIIVLVELVCFFVYKTWYRGTRQLTRAMYIIYAVQFWTKLFQKFLQTYKYLRGQKRKKTHQLINFLHSIGAQILFCPQRRKNKRKWQITRPRNWQTTRSAATTAIATIDGPESQDPSATLTATAAAHSPQN